MTQVKGSIARESFDSARAVLHATPLRDPRARPAIDLVAPPLRAAPRPGPTAANWSTDGPLVEASAALAAGTLTSRELVERSLAAIAAHDEQLVGMVDHDPADALEQADARDAELAKGLARGPLHGIPVTIKDVIDVAGLTTRCGSEVYEDHPTRDAAAVALLRDAGAVILGKVATHEFALGVTSPQCRNPHDPDRLAGGSSGGSAVAVATGMGLASLGTDTRASIRVPSALCGLVGLKPTYGRVPTDGVVSLSWTMDHVAPMTRTVADAAAMLDVLGPVDEPWATKAARIDPSRLRVGMVRTPFDEADPAVAAAVEAAVVRLASAGPSLGEALRPGSADLDLANAAGLIVSRCEAATQHRSFDLDPSGYWEEVGDQLREAASVPAVDYLEAQRLRRQLRDALLDEMDAYHLLVTPTTGVVAPPAADFAAYLMSLARNAIPFSFVGFPAVTVPCGTVDGMPVGLQLVAAPGREDLLLAGAALVERAAP
jgi:Asp-tRNA(Asn)/Glu-tRNA(Gln) amidotransferase A subunit family amidase